QPISVGDAAAAIVGEVQSPSSSPRVVDLVGPEIVSYRSLIERLGKVLGRTLTVDRDPIEDAVRRAREGGYFGLRPHDLACLLCDEVSDADPVRRLVGRPLQGLDDMIRATVEIRTPGSAPS